MKKIVEVHNQNKILGSPLKAVYCDSFLCRLRGLMFRKSLPAEDGLILVYGSDSRMDASIHMMFVNFDLAVIWINSAGKVVDKVLAKQWKLAYLPKSPARYVLEIVPERLGEFEIGDRVNFINEKTMA
jgi:uncharacterized membrane protein (UPF0127 family)